MYRVKLNAKVLSGSDSFMVGERECAVFRYK